MLLNNFYLESIFQVLVILQKSFQLIKTLIIQLIQDLVFLNFLNLYLDKLNFSSLLINFYIQVTPINRETQAKFRIYLSNLISY